MPHIVAQIIFLQSLYSPFWGPLTMREIIPLSFVQSANITPAKWITIKASK